MNLSFDDATVGLSGLEIKKNTQVRTEKINTNFMNIFKQYYYSDKYLLNIKSLKKHQFFLNYIP